MRKFRFMIVSHHKDVKLNGTAAGKPVIHNLVGTYHWHRIDDEHVMAVADYPIKNHIALSTHPSITVLPQLGSAKKLHKHIVNVKHLEAVKKNFAIDESHVSEDLLEQLAAKYGPMFTV